MYDVHVDYCNAVMNILLKSAQSLWELKGSEAIQSSRIYGKRDTYRLDAIPEIHMRTKYAAYDPNTVFVTEETGAQFRHSYSLADHRSKFPMTDVSDPFDRSVPTQRFLTQYLKDGKDANLWEIFSDASVKTKWEAELGGPAEITGSSSAITRLVQGVPIFSVIVNFVTRQLIVACSAGVYSLDLKRNILGKVDLPTCGLTATGFISRTSTTTGMPLGS